ncbi:hypothetical protein [Thalassobacillus sp. C254]|uniref:hypothetical protein n=1 Tax=Thalassobacillus sp. C254 TaxID=1225341 RepID=UPI0006D1DD97|nr:hypothetical protein [Thalassobacillus sp. C254]
MLGILGIISISLTAALVTKRVAFNLGEENELRNRMSQKVPIIRKFFLNSGVFLFFVNHGSLTLVHLTDIIIVLLCTLLFVFLNFLIATYISNASQYYYEDKASLLISAIRRNSPIALFVAMTSFPPLVGIAVSLGYVLQFPILYLLANCIKNQR